MAFYWKRLFLPILLIAPMGLAQASDMAREQRLAEQIEEGILVGDAVRLQADGVAFLAIHTEAEIEPAKGGLVLLHGMGAHPDWPEIINPLRSELPALGWETLSIQLPVAAANAGYRAYLPLFPEAGQRIAAAIAYLKARGDGPVYVIAHSLGSTMAVEYLAAHGDDGGQAAGLIAIGLSADPDRTQSGTLAALAQIQLPILDLYGSEDVESVRSSAAARKSAAVTGGNPGYTQKQVDGADHFFHDREQPLLEAVSSWLEQGGAY